MRCALVLHPDFHCDAVHTIEAEVERSAPQRLMVRYRLSGAVDDILLPSGVAERTDELWRHTCLEAFVQAAGDPGYRELNLSPGGAWAAYRFDGYRRGMADADVGPPDARPAAIAGRLEMASVWDLDLPADVDWNIGLSAVIEERSGRISYWALRHPPGAPNFHHADGFAVRLPAPSPP